MDLNRLNPRGLARSFLHAAIWRIAFRSPWPVMVVLILIAVGVMLYFPESSGR